jgi:hypothetical protein
LSEHFLLGVVTVLICIVLWVMSDCRLPDGRIVLFLAAGVIQLLSFFWLIVYSPTPKKVACGVAILLVNCLVTMWVTLKKGLLD